MKNLSLALLASSLLTLNACKCSDNEDDRDQACASVTEAVQKAFAACGITATELPFLCEATCENADLYCIEEAEVDECRDAIAALTCEELASTTIPSLVSCANVLNQVSEACTESSDFDDDDWD